MYTLGIDIGTSGTKTALFGMDGKLIASSTAEYQMFQEKNGWAEQNPNDWWTAVIATIKNVINKSDICSKDIAGIGLSGQMHGMVLLDENNAVIRNAIIWCDQRTAAECSHIENLIGRERLIEINANPAVTGFTASKILWIRNNEFKNYEKIAHILLPKDYIRFMLTGDLATDVSDAGGTQLLDVPNRCWSKEIIEKLEIDAQLLPKIYESFEVTGSITSTVAQTTGLTEGTRVVAGAGDNAAAAIGTGVISNGKAFTTIGTSGVVFAHTDKAIIDKKARIHTLCSAVPGKWHVMGVTQSAGLSLRWFRDNFCIDITRDSLEKNIDEYITMDKIAKESPVGANRLLFLPYLMGERTPHLDADLRGMFYGISAMHSRGDMIRAVMEGVAFSLNDCLSVFSEIGIEVNEMSVCGGGGNSKFWKSILSDVFKCNITTLNNKEGAVLGAAILAMVGTGLYKSVEEACKNILSPLEINTPNHDNIETYEKYYNLYGQLYPLLKDSFKTLSNL